MTISSHALSTSLPSALTWSLATALFQLVTHLANAIFVRAKSVYYYYFFVYLRHFGSVHSRFMFLCYFQIYMGGIEKTPHLSYQILSYHEYSFVFS